MVETLSLIARGIPKVASYATVNAGYAMAYGTVFRKLNELTPMVRQYNKWLLQGEASLDTGFDNFQSFLSSEFQREGTSASSLHATCRFAKRSFPVLPSVGSVVESADVQYVVIQIVHSTVYAALLRIKSLQHGTRHPLPWPTIGWTIVSLEGADEQNNAIDY